MAAANHADFIDYDLALSNRVTAEYLNYVNDRLFVDVKNVMDMGYATALGDQTAATVAANGSALAAALATGAQKVIIPGPEPFYVNREFVMSTAGQWLDIQGELKLVDDASLFSQNGTYKSYVLYVQAPECRVTGLVNGNSTENTYIDGATTYRYWTVAGQIHMVGGIMVGFFGNQVANPIDLYNLDIDVTVKECSGPGVDFSMPNASATFLNSGNTYIWNSQFKVRADRNQGVGCAPAYCVGCEFEVVGYLNYTYAFQYYYNNVACGVTGSSFFARSRVDASLVDPDLKSGSAYPFAGAFVMGKSAANPNVGCTGADIQLYGTYFTFQEGMQFSSADNVIIRYSENVGFDINPNGDAGFTGNRLTRCGAAFCDQSGFYLNNTLAGGQFFIEDCWEIGNCTKVLSDNKGGRILNAGTYRFDAGYVLVRHYSRKSGTKPDYGLVDYNTSVATYDNLIDCDFIGAGNTANIITNNTASPPVAGALTKAGNTKAFTYQTLSSPVDGTLDTFPSNATGMIFMTCGAQYGIYAVDTDGVTTTVVGMTMSANADDADMANNACVFATGNTVNFRNRLAAAEPVSIVYNYQKQ